MGLTTQLLALSIRLVWFICAGLWLGTAYFLLMLVLSPFWTLSSGHVTRNTAAIMWLKSASGGRGR